MTWLEGVLTYVIGFAITLLIEMFIVGPSAKKQPTVLPQKARKSILFSLFLSLSCLGWCVSCLYADMSFKASAQDFKHNRFYLIT